MKRERQVYLLDPKNLTPETIAVTFAKTSRSPQSFRQIAAELTEEKSSQFHEKWVVGYGHSSVAEHAVLHIAVENLSRLAVETLEGNRLASYTEKSTRYQKWDSEDFYLPTELNENEELRNLYLQTCQMLFDNYLQSLPAVLKVIEEENPRHPNEDESAFEKRMRSEYVDVSRFFLPACALANVGMTINARALEHAIKKMLSSPLDEVKALGEEIKKVALENVPTLMKYADPVPYLTKIADALGQEAVQVEAEKSASDWCQLVSFDQDAEDRVLASALYRYGDKRFSEVFAYVGSLPSEEKQRLGHLLTRDCSKFDIPIRELEHASFTFDLILDQGAYFEVKRHRMMTQTPQALTTHLGYAMPRKIVLASLESRYRQSMLTAQNAYEQIAAWNPSVASYVVPNGFNRRVLMTLNLRSAIHFINLRSAPNAHFSVRRVAQRIAEEICRVTPILGTCLQYPTNETWQSIEKEHFSAI
jgi:thymidylate synthase ThyX